MRNRLGKNYAVVLRFIKLEKLFREVPRAAHDPASQLGTPHWWIEVFLAILILSNPYRFGLDF
jgi:hypothetical protein